MEKERKKPTLCREQVSLPPSFRACLFYCPTTKWTVFSNASIFQLGKSVPCHVVHKTIAPTVIDFDDSQPRLDSAWQSRAERSFPLHASLSRASSSLPELRKAEITPLNSALTPAVPGTAFSWAQVRPQHLLFWCVYVREEAGVAWLGYSVLQLQLQAQRGTQQAPTCALQLRSERTAQPACMCEFMCGGSEIALGEGRAKPATHRNSSEISPTL